MSDNKQRVNIKWVIFLLLCIIFYKEVIALVIALGTLIVYLIITLFAMVMARGL